MTKVTLPDDPRADMGTRLTAAFAPFTEGGLVYTNDIYKMLNIDKTPSRQNKRTYNEISKHMHGMGWRAILLRQPRRRTVTAYAKANIDRQLLIFSDPVTKTHLVTDEPTAAFSPIPPRSCRDLEAEDAELRHTIKLESRRKIPKWSRDGSGIPWHRKRAINPA